MSFIGTQTILGVVGIICLATAGNYRSWPFLAIGVIVIAIAMLRGRKLPATE